MEIHKQELETMDVEFQKKFKLLDVKLRIVLADTPYDIGTRKTEFGTEFQLHCNLKFSEVCQIAKTFGLPKPYAEHSLIKLRMTLGGKDTEHILKYWYAWGVRMEYIKDTNGFKTVKEWLEKRKK